MRVAKAVAAAVGATVTALTAALADDVFSASETAQAIAVIVEGALTVYAVWRVPNTAPRRG